MSVGVERIRAEASSAWQELLAEGERPLIIEGSVDERTRAARWSPPALRSLVGAREVTLTRTDSEKFDFTQDGEQRYTDSALPFVEALDLIESAGERGPCYYVRRASLSELGLDGAGLPRAWGRAGGAKRTENLWLSCARSVTVLHYDPKNNLLTQMHGTKEVTLFPSSEQARMHAHGLSRTAFFYSRVDPEAVDRELFPDFPSELGTTFELRPGDTLFIPPFWWHHVRSRELSVSVNVFWRARAEQCLVANSIDYLRMKYRLRLLAEFFADAGERERPLKFLELATRARERGLARAATLFCGAATHLTLRALARRATATTDGGVAAGEGGGSDGADASTAQALAEKGVIDEREGGRVRLWTFLADFAALHGKAPRAPELEAMLSGVSDFVSKHPLQIDEDGERADENVVTQGA